jgi:glycosyltransferase involved in cell wall biosynthesis
MEWVSLTPITKLKVKRIKKIVCNSEFTKKYIDRKFHVKSLVLTPPVIVQREYTKSKKEKRILHVGRFGIEGNGSSYKKQDILAAVFSDMVEKGLKDWKLVFVMGVMEQDKHVVQEFEKQYRNLPVEFIVNPTNDELWREYDKATIYWHASGFGEDLERHPDRAEHFGISTVEAMGAGAVPVVFAAGGQKEIITAGENGFFWQSEKDLAEITLDLIQHQDKREKIADQAAKRADAYSSDVFGQKIRDLVT